MTRGKGWHGHPVEHGLASRGVKTAQVLQRKYKPSVVKGDSMRIRTEHVSEDDWWDWAYEAESIKQASKGELEVGWPMSQGEPITEEHIKNFTELARRIQEASESQKVIGVSTLYRGESYESEEGVKRMYPIGAKIKTRGLTSTATEMDPAYAYADTLGSRSVPVIVRYQNPNGMPGIQAAPFGIPGNEVIMPAGVEYRVARRMKEGKYFIIDMYSNEKHKLPAVDASPPKGSLMTRNE
jgi:hypothetical protein